MVGFLQTHELLKEEEEKEDPHVLIFLQEYEALFSKVTASYSHTLKLQKLVRRLKADLVCTATKAGVVASMYNSSEEMIANMKKVSRCVKYSYNTLF